MVLLPIFNHSCYSAVVPIAPGVVTQIINTLLFLLSAHQSSSQSNILITALPLMFLRSGTNSLTMCAVQHQLPPSERSLKLTCLQKHIPHSLSCHPVSPWYDLAYVLGLMLTNLLYVQLHLRVHQRWRLSAIKVHIRLDPMNNC